MLMLPKNTDGMLTREMRMVKAIVFGCPQKDFFIIENVMISPR